MYSRLGVDLKARYIFNADRRLRETIFSLYGRSIGVVLGCWETYNHLAESFGPGPYLAQIPMIIVRDGREETNGGSMNGFPGEVGECRARSRCMRLNGLDRDIGFALQM